MNSLSIKTSATTPLAIAFQRTADRWSHVIQLLTPDGPIEILTSVEGTPDEDWPASGALQEVTSQGETILLGVGMAGKSHWSLACSIENDDDGSRTLFDFACLAKGGLGDTENGPWIGSTYKTSNAVEAVESTSRETLLTIRHGETTTTVVIENPESGPAGSHVNHVQGSQLLIKPLHITESPAVASRWSYRLKTR